MLKCLFVDLTSISSTKPKSKFKPAQIEKLADAILATDGLISPLILSQTGSENGVGRYTIIEGDLAYYAALRAKEKDLHKAEMVNAFVIPADCQSAAIAQLTLLAQTKSKVVEPEPPIVERVGETTPPTAAVEDRDELFERLSAEIARQLVPFSQKIDTVATIVDRHERVLVALQSSTAVVTPPPVEPAPIVPPTIEPVTQPNKISTPKTPKAKTSKARQKPQQSLEVPIAPVTTAEKATTTKQAAAPKKTTQPDLFAGIEPEKLARTLQLINTASLNELVLKMSKSLITKAPQTLATDLIAKRDTQPDRIFESWEAILSAKVSKLTQKVAVEIVNKLK
jgi:hypothetical protein